MSMLARAYQVLLAARPTAVNLRWALDDLRALLAPLPPARRREAAYRRAAEICDEDVEICRRIGQHGLRGNPPPEAARRSHPGADPLQRRLARHRRLGHGAGADLPGARCRAADPCLGRRDAAAQPGRQPDGLGARQARRAAHRDRRQCRRPPDAARPGRFLHRRHRPHDAPRRRLQQDRHLPEGAGGARQRRAVLCRPALSHHRLDDRRRPARDPDRGAPCRRGLAHVGPHRGRRGRRGRPAARGQRRSPIRPSTSRRRGWSPR